MPPIEPGFYWSHTLGQDIDVCLRRVFYRVFASWGGWTRANGGTPHLLYQAKSSNTLMSYVGTLVHYVIQKIIERIRAQLRLAPREMLLARLEERMRWEISYSAQKKWKKVDHPKRATLILQQHLLGEDLHSTQIEEAVDRGQRALTSFLDNYLPHIAGMHPHQLLLIDSLDSISYRDFTLFMSPDLVLRVHEDRVVIDWKTGVMANEDQLKVYSKYLVLWEARENDHELAPENITARSIPLLHPENEVILKVLPEHLDEAMNRIDDDINLMKKLHPYGIDREELAFPKTEHTGDCEYCSFRFYCDLRPR